MSEGKIERLARDVASPILLNLLVEFTGRHMSEAITKDLKLTSLLEENIEVARAHKAVLLSIPFYERGIPYIKQPKWINWFIDHQLKEKRKDLYVAIIYNPKGRSYLIKQVPAIVDFILSDEV